MKFIESGPDWLAAEMPPGYTTRLLEIQRLTDDLEAMARFGRVLWASGEDLADAVRETFAALKFEAHVAPGSVNAPIVVAVDAQRRLLVRTAASDGPIQKKDAVLTELFDAVREIASDTDRVLLVVNCDPTVRPANRRPPLEPDALKLIQRLGANVLTAKSLFALWTLSLQDRERARAIVERIHAQDGGLFDVPSLAVV